MEKNAAWIENLPEAIKTPFQKIYDLVFVQDKKIKELESRLTEAENKRATTEKELAEVKEMAKNAVMRAVNAEDKLEKLESKENINSKFIGSIIESQNFDETMTQIESMAKQIIDCDNVTFYRLDESSNKFYNSDGNYRDWTAYQDAEELRSTLINGEVNVQDNKALLPIYSEGGKAVGVIVADSPNGFINTNFAELAEGSQFSNTVALAIKKDVAYQRSITDPLTGLKNRNGNDDFVKTTVVKRLNEKKPVSIIMTDIDHFKKFNDTFGHEAGDEVIKSVAAVLENETRSGEDCAFRFGGEELVVICGGDGVQAMEIAERIRKAVEATVHNFEKNGIMTEEHCTVSVGVAQMNPDIPIHVENVMEEYKKSFIRADNAIYVAKASGRNQVIAANPEHKVEYLAHKAAKIAEAGGQNFDDAKSSLVNAIKRRNMNDITNTLREAASNNSSLFNNSEEVLGEIDSFVIPEPHMILSFTDNDMTNYFLTTQMDAKEIMDKIAMGANVLDFMQLKKIQEVTKAEYDIIDKLDSKMKLEVNKDENLFKFEAGRKVFDINIRDAEMSLSEARRLTKNCPDNKSLLNDFIRVKCKLRGINDNIVSNTVSAIKDIKRKIIKNPIVAKLDKVPNWADKMKDALKQADKLLTQEEKNIETNKDNDIRK